MFTHLTKRLSQVSYLKDQYIALYRSEEHTSELQSRLHIVCRLLLEKKNTPSPADRRGTQATPPREPPEPVDRWLSTGPSRPQQPTSTRSARSSPAARTCQHPDRWSI